MRTAWRWLRIAGRGLWMSARFWARHWMLFLGLVAVWPLLWTLALDGVLDWVSALCFGVAFACLVPGFPNEICREFWPVPYERWIGGPLRRRAWRQRVEGLWPTLCRESGLSVQREARAKDGQAVMTWVSPSLVRVDTEGNGLSITAQVRMGQTPDELVAAAPRFAAAFGAYSHTVRVVSPSVVAVDMAMADHLSIPMTARGPRPDVIEVEAVTVGRFEDGSAWALPLVGRSTLVAGCSGSGKGSVLWGVCGGLAPAVRADLVRLYGVDLKAGLEVGMGAGLFTTTAYTHDDAIAVLRRLVRVIEERGGHMLGVSRLHQPMPGDPLHVLVIDELAALTAYETDAKKVKEANQLLARLLSQGRALGVLVVAFVQDPTKETVKARNLFTQTLALRLRTSDETRMVLGDGMADRAPAHKISPAAQGTGWLVGDDGSTVRVRADYWPDELVRETAAVYAAPVTTTLDDGDEAGSTAAPGPGPDDGQPGGPGESGPDVPRQRKPRKPRRPRGGSGQVA